MTSPGPRDRPQAHAEATEAAFALIARFLAGFDPVIAPFDQDVFDAALAYARSGYGDDTVRLSWTRWAYRQAPQQFGAHHPVRLQISRIYQSVLARQGLTVDAVTVCADRLTLVEALGDPLQVVTTRMSLANALHDDGQCGRARAEIAMAWRGWREDAADVRHGQQIVLSQAAILTGCGFTVRAQRVLHRRSAVLAGIGRDGREHAAAWLVGAEQAHPRVCQREPRPQPPTSAAASRQAWLNVLTSGEPAPGAREQP